MARKLTAKQRKARQRASYYKREYKKTIEATKYLQRFGIKIEEMTEPTKITKTSLNKARRIYTESRRKATKIFGGYLDVSTGKLLEKLPTKEEAYRQYRIEQEIPTKPIDFNPYNDTIEELKSVITTFEPKAEPIKTDRNYNKNVLPKLQQAKDKVLDSIDKAVAKYGEKAVAEVLSQNTYVQRIQEMETWYAYKVIEELGKSDFDIVSLVGASVDNALQEL